jgi:hypothetical protein
MRLFDLPYESLLILCGYLHNKQLFQLRLVSKRLKQVVDQCGCLDCWMEVMLRKNGFAVDLRINEIYRNIKSIVEEADFSGLESSHEVEMASSSAPQENVPHKDNGGLDELTQRKEKNGLQENASVGGSSFQKSPPSVHKNGSVSASRASSDTGSEAGEDGDEDEEAYFVCAGSGSDHLGSSKTEPYNGITSRNLFGSSAGKRADLANTPSPPPSSVGPGSDSPTFRKSVSSECFTGQNIPSTFPGMTTAAVNESEIKKDDLAKQTLFDSFSGKRTKIANKDTSTPIMNKNDGRTVSLKKEDNDEYGFSSDSSQLSVIVKFSPQKKEAQAPLPDVRSGPIADNPDVFDDPLFTPKAERFKTAVSTPVSAHKNDAQASLADIRSGPIAEKPDVFDDPQFAPKAERFKTAVFSPVSEQDVQREPAIDKFGLFDDPLFTPKQERSKMPVSTIIVSKNDNFMEDDQCKNATPERAPSECTTVYGEDENEEDGMTTANTTHEVNEPLKEGRELEGEKLAIVFWVSQLKMVEVNSTCSSTLKLVMFQPILDFLQLPIFHLSSVTMAIPNLYEATPEQINEFMVAISRSQSIASVEAGLGTLDLVVPPVVSPWDKLSALTITLKTTAMVLNNQGSFTSMSYPNLSTVAIAGKKKGTTCRLTVSHVFKFLKTFGTLTSVNFRGILLELNEGISDLVTPNIRIFKFENTVIENTSKIPQFTTLNTLLKASLLPFRDNNIILIYPNQIQITNNSNTDVILKKWSPIEIISHITATNTPIHRIEFAKKPVLTIQLLDSLKHLPNLRQLSAQVDGSQLKQSMTKEQIKKSIVAAIKHLARNATNLTAVSFFGPGIPKDITYNKKALKSLANWF